jgi:hypothetical protein
MWQLRPASIAGCGSSERCEGTSGAYNQIDVWYNDSEEIIRIRINIEFEGRKMSDVLW